jgi:beta-glucanase (GH16 family)
VARPAAASSVLSARVSPAAPGRPATLERLDATTGTWSGIAATKVGARSKAAEFTAPQSLDGTTLRVTFGAFKGQPAITTSSALAGAWGEADFTDEFNGSRLSNAWVHRGGAYNPQGLRRCSKGSPKATKVTGGALQLWVTLDKAKKHKTCTAKRGDGKPIGKFKYRLNGHVSTQSSVSLRYGVVAARMKFQKARGQHASVWLQPTNMTRTKSPTGGSEVDIIEWFGQGGKNSGLTSFIYHPSKKGSVKVGGFLGNTNGYLSGKGDQWWKRYHVFSVEWTPNAYVFRIDGHETWRTTQGVSRVPEFVILSLLSSDYELPLLGSEKKLPQKSNVDWVRVWQDKTQL